MYISFSSHWDIWWLFSINWKILSWFKTSNRAVTVGSVWWVLFQNKRPFSKLFVLGKEHGFGWLHKQNKPLFSTLRKQKFTKQINKGSVWMVISPPPSSLCHLTSKCKLRWSQNSARPFWSLDILLYCHQLNASIFLCRMNLFQKLWRMKVPLYYGVNSTLKSKQYRAS